jgi:6-phosphogluconolactonase
LFKVLSLSLVMSVIAGLAGCSAGTSHTAYVTLTGADEISGYYVNNGSGRLFPIPGSPFAAGIGPSSIVAHPSKKLVYVANSGEGTISLFRVDKRAGALIEVTPRTATGIQPTVMAMDAAGQFLFVGNVGSNDIWVYRINSGTGALAPAAAPVPSATPIAMNLLSTGKLLYVANANSATVSGYSIGNTGSLSAISGSPFGVGQNPSSLASDPSGKFLYVANLLAGTFSGFTIDSTSGALTPIAGSPFTPGTRPIAAAVDLSGKYLYVADLSANNIFAYSIGSTGVPTQISRSPFTAGTAPVFLVIDSTGKFLFAGNESSNNISGFVIDPKTGALSNLVQFGTGSAPTSMVIVP